ncbi:MAG: MOSC domain-containing protein [Hyphomicrobiales bacterium]|nr:MAG: MOSC domain-containing protein [Hyphomicrobiales bacterium]
MTTLSIRELWIYPIKSLGGVRVAEAAITSAGSLELDREWIVVDSDNHKVWQGDIPRMTLVRVSLDATNLGLSMDGMSPVSIPRRHDGAPATISVYKRLFPGIDAGDGVAAWLTAALGQKLRLVRVGDAAHRWDGLNPLHVLSDGSLTALNQALIEQGDSPVRAQNFRPNVVLGGAEPWSEEQYPTLDFGEARIVLREPCVRCELPNISLIDASRGKQPLKLIGRLSRQRPAARPASFGTYCRAEGTALRTGMEARLA